MDEFKDDYSNVECLRLCSCQLKVAGVSPLKRAISNGQEKHSFFGKKLSSWNPLRKSTIYQHVLQGEFTTHICVDTWIWVHKLWGSKTITLSIALIVSLLLQFIHTHDSSLFFYAWPYYKQNLMFIENYEDNHKCVNKQTTSPVRSESRFNKYQSPRFDNWWSHNCSRIVILKIQISKYRPEVRPSKNSCLVSGLG